MSCLPTDRGYTHWSLTHILVTQPRKCKDHPSWVSLKLEVSSAPKSLWTLSKPLPLPGLSVRGRVTLDLEYYQQPPRSQTYYALFHPHVMEPFGHCGLLTSLLSPLPPQPPHPQPTSWLSSNLPRSPCVTAPSSMTSTLPVGPELPPRVQTHSFN